MGAAHLCGDLWLLSQGSSLLLPLQAAQQILADLHRGPQLASQMVGLLGQGVAEDGARRLHSVPLGQGRAEALDLPLLVLICPLGRSFQLLLFFPHLALKALNLLRVTGTRQVSN